ncbi:MAG: ABC transporter permease subunit [Bacteriovoracaceae bacterium]|nr:ABC transporter permease subunit [Bacteriovoracaceae bacterium]
MKIIIIARYTLKELLKSKLLWNVVGLGALIAILSWVSSEFTFGVPSRVALDIGLASLSLSGYGIAIFIGAGLISKEIESRTIYMVLSRPVNRGEFLLGKILGLSVFLAINFLLLSSFSLITVMLLGTPISSLILWSIVFNYLECLMLMVLVVSISLEVNTVLTILFSLLLLVTGHVIGETRKALYVTSKPALAAILDFYHLVLPGFYKFNLKDLVLYEQTVSLNWLLSTFSYGLLYSAFLISLSVWMMNKKELH